MNATEKHSQTASAKREVDIDTSYEKKTDVTKENVIMRRIKNLNASRTLNFVFRQLNQEFHSILHLKDLKVAFYNGFPGSMTEFNLNELADLVNEYMEKDLPGTDEATGIGHLIRRPTGTEAITETQPYLEQIIMNEYGKDRVSDHLGGKQQLVQRITISGEDDEAGQSYLRVIPPKKKSELGGMGSKPNRASLLTSAIPRAVSVSFQSQGNNWIRYPSGKRAVRLALSASGSPFHALRNSALLAVIVWGRWKNAWRPLMSSSRR